MKYNTISYFLRFIFINIVLLNIISMTQASSFLMPGNKIGNTWDPTNIGYDFKVTWKSGDPHMTPKVIFRNMEGVVKTCNLPPNSSNSCEVKEKSPQMMGIDDHFWVQDPGDSSKEIANSDIKMDTQHDPHAGWYVNEFCTVLFGYDLTCHASWQQSKSKMN